MKDLSIDDVFKLVILPCSTAGTSLSRSSLDIRSSEFSIEDVKSKVFNSSDMILAASGKTTMVAAAAVMTTANSQLGEFCVYCKKKGHLVGDCHKLKAKNDKSDKPAKSDKSDESK
ncbi:hypothetical protein GGF42_000432, partial [Coemansia sp. RSA 2424]